MKKRLLALVLCLVMMTSLLPITAAAECIYLRISSSGFEKGVGGGYVMKAPKLEGYYEPQNMTLSTYLPIIFQGLYHDKELTSPVTDAPFDGGVYYLNCIIGNRNPESFSGILGALKATNCSLVIPGFEALYVTIESVSGGYSDPLNPENSNFYRVVFQVTHDHDWQFTTTENSVTATCGSCKKEVSVSLKADSVTLPESPFNAQVILNGITEEEIKKEFRYLISPIRYKFKAPGDSAFTEITPADGAREGTYQAAVTLSPIEVAARYARNDDGTTQGLVTEPDGSITLYTQYTAVNPETTAQTGDDRPIELMMGSVVVFSALAAAAFILDSKRRSQQ